MPINVTCACGQTYPIREEFAGQRVQCPFCQQMLTIPAPPSGRRKTNPPQPAPTTPHPAHAQRLVVADDGDCDEVAAPEAPARRGGGVWMLLGVLTVLFLLCGGAAALVVVAVVSNGDLTALLSTQPIQVTTATAPATTVAPVTSPAVPPAPNVPTPAALPPLPTLPPPSERAFDGHLAPILAVGFSRDGRFALSAAGGVEQVGDRPVLDADNTVRVWDAQTGKEQRRARNFRDGIGAAAFAPDGRYAVLAGAGKWEDGKWSPGFDGLLHLWDLEKDEEVRVFQGPKRRVFSLAFSPDGKRLLSGWGDHSVRLWNVDTAAEIFRLDGHANTVTSVAFSPDGRFGLSGSADLTVRLWDLTKGTERKLFPGHKDIVWAVAFAPSGKQVVSAGGMQQAPAGGGFIEGAKDYDIRLWDVDTGAEVRRFPGHTKAVGCLAFSRDGRRLLSGGADNTVRLWQVDSGAQIASFDGHKDVVHAVEFFPDGRRALSGGEDKVLHVWNLSPDLPELIAQLDDADAKTRLDAVRQLPRFGTEVRSSLPALFKALTRDDPAFRAEVLAVLVKLGPLTKADAAQLVPLFKDRSFPAGRLYALDNLAALGADYPPTLPTLKEALGDNDLAVKRRALQLAGKLGAPARAALYPVLLDSLADADAGVAKDAGDALGKMGKPTAQDLTDLNDLLRSPKPAVRRYALIALANLGPEAAKALPRITETLTVDKDPEVRGLALAAAAKVQTDKKELGALLKRGLKDPDPNVCRQAVLSLAKLAPEPEASTAFLEALNHPNASVVKTAEELLPNVKFEKANAKALAAAMRASKSEAVRLRLMDTLVAVKADTADAGQALGEFLKEATGDTRVKIIAALGELGDGGRGAGPALAELLKDEDKAIRFEAALTLCKTRSEQASRAVSALVAALRVEKPDDKEGFEQQEMAHKALVRLGQPAVDALAKSLEKEYFGGNPMTVEGASKANARMAVIQTLEKIGGDAKDALKVLANTEREDRVPANQRAARQARLKIQQLADMK